jgi:hypothetical protein
VRASEHLPELWASDFSGYPPYQAGAQGENGTDLDFCAKDFQPFSQLFPSK